MREKLSLPRINKDALIVKAVTPAVIIIFSAVSIAHKNSRFIADKAYELTSEYGETPGFIKGTGWILSRLGDKEVDTAIRNGLKIFRQRAEYKGIPQNLWNALDELT